VKALVTDDSAAMRRIIQKALESDGWEVRTASNGKEAMAALARETSWDLLLTDWHMPELDGLGLVRAVRASSGYASLRIIVITSEGALNMVDTALQAGANDFLMKPFSSDSLCERIAEVMNGQG